MEQLVDAATIPYFATIILFILGVAFIGVSIFMFVVDNIDDEDAKEDKKIIITLLAVGIILLALGYYCKNIYSRYNNQTKSIVKDVIAREYPDATEFSFNLDTGYFTENGIKYKAEYQKTISNEEKLIITVNDFIAPDNNKSIKTLDIPKETKNNESTND